MLKISLQKILLGAALLSIMVGYQAVSNTANAVAFTTPIYSVQDVYVDDNGQSQNEAQLYVSNTNNSYVKFDISGLLSHLSLNNLMISKASLVLQGTFPVDENNLDFTAPLNQIDIYGASSNWDENTGFQSPNLPIASSTLASTVTLANVPAYPVQYIFNLDNYNFSAGSENGYLSFLLAPGANFAGTTTIFAATTPFGPQSSNGPQLDIQTAPVPEPASMLLLGISSLAGLLGLGRRKGN